jgi:NADH:ubiquinone oxidoreductase subunit 3 (subunit A)
LIFLISFVFGLIISLVIGILTKKVLWDRETLRSFECGFNSKDQGLLPFRFRFYLLANIFLVFDVELILLFPFIIKSLRNLLWAYSWIFGLLLIVLSLGLFHEWNQKILEWVAYCLKLRACDCYSQERFISINKTDFKKKIFVLKKQCNMLYYKIFKFTINTFLV